MVYEVVIAPRAVDDLKDIVFYITPDRPEAAKRLAMALVERTKLLGSFPQSGRKVPEFDRSEIRELVLPPYRIVYQIDEVKKQVGVARFWHGARDGMKADDL